MKTAELRDAMVERVKAAYAEWPTFEDMPENAAHDMRVTYKGDLSIQKNYVEALHSICAVARPVGRSGNDLLGVTDYEATVSGQRIGNSATMGIGGEEEGASAE